MKVRVVSDTERQNPSKYDKQEIVYDNFSKMFQSTTHRPTNKRKINNLYYYSHNLNEKINPPKRNIDDNKKNSFISIGNFETRNIIKNLVL